MVYFIQLKYIKIEVQKRKFRALGPRGRNGYYAWPGQRKRGEGERKKEKGRDAPLGGRERGRGYFWHFIFWQNSNKVVYVLPWIVELFTYSTHRVHM